MTGKSSITLLAILVTGLLGGPVALAGEGVEGTAKADKLERCVEPTSVMRRRHFEFIKHQRDLTVHEGIRGSKYSLAGCVDCHARKDAQGHYVPINAEGEFCDRCHDYAAVEIDCYMCHSTVPGGK